MSRNRLRDGGVEGGGERLGAADKGLYRGGGGAF